MVIRHEGSVGVKRPRERCDCEATGTLLTTAGEKEQVYNLRPRQQGRDSINQILLAFPILSR